MTWDEKFIGLSKHIALWSKDPSTKVGAVVVGSRNRILSVGYNGLPRGMVDYPEILNNREIKYTYMCHAEANALDNADCSLDGATLYTTLFPCYNCAKKIVQRGIKKVVAPAPEGNGRWAEIQLVANNILSQCQVEVTYGAF